MEPLNTNEEYSESVSVYENISYKLLLLLTFSFPIFFIPSTLFPFEQTKIIFGAVLVLLSLVFYVFGQIKEGTVTVIKSPVVAALLAVPVVFSISALVNSQKALSFLGYGYEIGTVSFVALGVVTAILIALLAQTRERIFHFYTAIISSFAILALFHIARFILGPDFLSFGILNNPTSNLIGKWNDLASFFGLTALLSFLTLSLFSLGGGIKKLLYVTFGLSLALFAVINFTIGWYVLGFCALIVFLYKLKNGSSEDFDSETGIPQKRKYSILALSLILISLAFIFFGDRIADPFATRLGLGQVEVRPSWISTFNIAKGTLQDSPLFGAGPNSFLGEFLMHKPDSVNASLFWNAEFHYGVGLIPTFLVTTGILGLASWVIFFCLYLYRGVKVLLSRIENRATGYILISSFITSLYLWILTIFYIPSGVMFMLAFIFSGIFIAALVLDGQLETISYASLRSSRLGTSVVYSLILVIIVGVVWGAVYAKQLIAGIYFQKSIISLNSGGNVDDVEKMIAKAAKLGNKDLYYQSLIEINLLKMNQLLTSNQVSQEEAVSKLQALLGSSIAHAQTAVSINKNNYQNWISSGRIYEAVAPLQVEGAYDAAIKSYNQALTLNPRNPGFYLMIARLEASRGNFDLAKENIKNALTLKGNYTEAIFLLSQIQVQQGNIDEAISSVEAATEVAPNDPTLFFQLGLLKYNDKNYLGTVEAMSKAVQINSEYSNARYFLGLSLSRLGRTSEAITQFEEIAKLNPDNAEVKQILSNLRAGRQPLAEVEPPADAQPEARKTLPVSEQKRATSSGSI